MLVPHGALVLVADDRHLRLLRNRGRDSEPELEEVPPRALSRWTRDVPRHAGDVIHALQPMLAGGTDLILVAPPHLMGTLRREVPHRMRSHLLAEISKDLVRAPRAELAARLHEMVQ